MHPLRVHCVRHTCMLQMRTLLIKQSVMHTVPKHTTNLAYALTALPWCSIVMHTVPKYKVDLPYVRTSLRWCSTTFTAVAGGECLGTLRVVPTLKRASQQVQEVIFLFKLLPELFYSCRKPKFAVGEARNDGWH